MLSVSIRRETPSSDSSRGQIRGRPFGLSYCVHHEVRTELRVAQICEGVWNGFIGRRIVMMLFDATDRVASIDDLRVVVNSFVGVNGLI